MVIKDSEYLTFYPILRDLFIKRELKGVLPKGARKKDSYHVWKSKYREGDKNGITIVNDLFFGGSSTNSLYFYRKYDEFKRKPEATIDDEAYNNGLLYIGIQLLPEHEVQKRNGQLLLFKEVTFRHSIFCKIYAQNINSLINKKKLSSEKELLTANNSTHIEDSSENLSKEELSIQSVKDYFTIAFKHDLLRKDMSLISGSLKENVESFHSLLRENDYLSAFDLLSLSYRDALCQNDIANFKKLFSELPKFNSIHIDNIMSRPTIIEGYHFFCRVSYAREILEDPSTFINDVQNEHSPYMELFRRIYKSEINGSKEIFEFEHFEAKFHEQFFLQYAKKENKIIKDNNVFSRIFISKKKISWHSHHYCECRLISGEWLINRLFFHPEEMSIW